MGGFSTNAPRPSRFSHINSALSFFGDFVTRLFFIFPTSIIDKHFCFRPSRYPISFASPTPSTTLEKRRNQNGRVGRTQRRRGASRFAPPRRTAGCGRRPDYVDDKRGISGARLGGRNDTWWALGRPGCASPRFGCGAF
jgi:hypothetical protein